MLLSNYLFKTFQHLLKGFIFKCIILCFTLPNISLAQEKLGFKSFSNIASYGSLVTKYKNRVIFSFNGNVSLDANKPHNLNVVLNNLFDTIQTNLFHLINNPAGSFFGITPFTNYSNKLFYWGLGDSYDAANRLTFVFGNANQNDLSLLNHKAYNSKYYHRGKFIHSFLNDSVFVSVHNFKWYHPSSLPYGTSIWWFNKNMDTLQQKVYFEVSGNTDLTPLSVYPLPDKDILVAGFTDTLNVFNTDAFVMRLDSVGNVKYARSIGTTGHENMYLTKVGNKYYMIGSSVLNYTNYPTTDFYVAEIDINNGNIGKSYKTSQNLKGMFCMHDPSGVNSSIYMPCMIGQTPSQYNKSCYFLIDTNGVISKQYLHSQTSNGYWNSYTMPIVTDSLKNVYGSIMSYNSNSDPFYTKLFKLDSNLVACYPSDVPFSFTTTIANGALHSLPISIVTAKDSIFEVTNAGAIVQGHGFNTMVDECSSYVSIEERTIQNQIKLYPNPTTNLLQIEIEEDIDYIKVYNQLGKEVTYKLVSQKSIEVSGLSGGVYFIEIKTSNGIIRQKFIKE